MWEILIIGILLVALTSYIRKMPINEYSLKPHCIKCYKQLHDVCDDCPYCNCRKRFADELTDFHPSTYLSKFRQTSFTYLLKMGLFYTVLGLAGSSLVYEVQYALFAYEEPVVPISLVSGIMAGPIEETLFFGLPFAFTGNSFVMMGTGVAWSMLHLFNLPETGYEGMFSASNFAFTIPSIFFSLRAWRSGSGLFAVFFHSAWNAFAVIVLAALGEMPFMVFDAGILEILDALLVAVSVVLLAVTYPLYRWRLKREMKKELEKL